MADASKKVVTASGKTTPLEDSVGKALAELEHGSKDLAPELAGLYITAAKEVDVAANKKAIVVFVPFRQHKKFLKIQSRLIRELEKKFSGKHVLIVAQRTILAESYTRKAAGALRPRSRTLTAVHTAVLDDLVYPTQIVAKRTRVRSDQSKLLKVYLDPKDRKEVDFKLKTFAAVYQKLTSKTVEFDFPADD